LKQFLIRFFKQAEAAFNWQLQKCESQW